MNLTFVRLGFLTIILFGVVLSFQATPRSIFHRRLGRLHGEENDEEDDGVQKNLQLFLSSAEGFGPCRFVVQGQGAILECVGTVTNMRSSTNPKTGKKLITISNDSGFETHFRTDQIEKITFSTIDKFGKKLRINRFIGNDGETNLLSLILHTGKDEDAGSTAKREAIWDSARSMFSDEFKL